MASAGTTSSSVQLLLITTCFLLSISQETKNSVAAAADSPPHPPFSFSFDFTNQSGYSSADLRYQGDAKVNGKLIDLTCDSVQPSNDSCTGAGRLSYNHPVPLHDDTTLASFNTSFTFEIKIKVNDSWPGDGMAFFLTSFPSRMPPDNPSGEYLGLLNNNDAAPYGPDQFVAVEFDTYTNVDNHDPSVNHIGIDINSVCSRNTTSLPQGQTLSGMMTATIKFDNITQTLVASLELDSYPEPIVVTYQLPDLRTFLPREVSVGFSAATGYYVELHQILAWSFNSTLAPTIPPKGHDNNKTAMIIIGGAVGLVLLVVMAWLILSCWKWTNRHRAFENQGRKQGPTRFAYQDLAAATDNFCQERKLGQGFFGVVYSGYLKKLGCHVAVKEILNKPDVVLGPNNSHFYSEFNAITLVKHKNLVNLIGWCRGNSCNFVDFMCWCWKNQNNKLFLVYELVPKGNLHDNLHKEETLPWETRYKIVKDITSALLYLHHECDPFILHRDIKPSNILLNDSFNAKLADFGLSRIVDPENNSKILTIPVGTEDYLDPQCKKPVGVVEFSRSSDVYSFGIVLLEIACGKQGSMLLREQVWQLYINRSLLQAADDKLKGEFNISEMESVLILGLWCSYPDSNKKRPTMEQVMAVLEHGRPLPDLNSLDTITSSVSTQLELEMYIDPHAPTSAASSSNEQNA